MLDTAITAFLSQRGTEFRVLMQAREAVSIEDAAILRGIATHTMVKTMVLRDMGNQYALACCPGDRQIDPKKVRALLQTRRMTCVSSDQVEMLTGYKLGTVTPLLLKTPMPIIFDYGIRSNRLVTISSGERIAGIELALDDLVAHCQPSWGDIVR
ncbi:aminoacyl-tRNA deacylase [Vibrio hangzhouensis]|uniref:aminoacyl-tRNA deacylase n=1 Tax=Vibrio hangzhouensis TaxID=462991 RepID=UPI001C96A38E|nr:YbaK/EbsC family protein [Vibrio hangzhouensis]MBY6196998.1 YbaK/EbsC family protein [Vibrio hangzhouensis]